jgi:hypothetical protein
MKTTPRISLLEEPDLDTADALAISGATNDPQTRGSRGSLLN